MQYRIRLSSFHAPYPSVKDPFDKYACDLRNPGKEEVVCRLKALKRGSTEIERRLLHVCVEVEGLLGITDSAG